MELLKFCKDLYKIPRSLTGDGVFKSLKYIQTYVPFKINKVKSGTKVFDWTVPPEWNIRGGYIIDLKSNKKLVDFKNHNLHVVGYSCPVNKILNFKELEEHLYYLKDQPEAIPYITSYYKKNWGFCLSYNDYLKINKNSNFQVVIDSDYDKNGNLLYGEFYIPGKIKKEIFFSSYICHPQMVNNELSGPAVLTGIAKNLINRENYYSYRFVLLPETIGSITYISKNLRKLQKNIFAGFNISCVGDEKAWSFLPSRPGNTISDRVALYILKQNVKKYTKYQWLDRGSDERQYCAPHVNLPICSIMRSKYGTYPEYHTSLDNFDLVTSDGLNQSLDIYMKVVEFIENNNYYPSIKVFCEPQLGKRGLYPNISTKESGKKVRNLMNFISYCDGENSILNISELCKIDLEEALEHYSLLKKNNLL